MNSSGNLKSIFGQIEDHRSHINQLHNLIDILLIGIITVISGAETWEQMVRFANSKEDFLNKFLELPNGIPSKVTINRVFSAIDGKTIRGAKSHGKKSPIHMVSAWACENNLVLGQIKTNEKSNEITAIPNLLDILDVSGNIVSIDAMGTQKEIAKKIIDNEANYILAVKGNQPQLLEDIQDEFEFLKQIDKNEDLGHGRIETRTCSVITDFQFIKNKNDWKNLKSIIRIESVREFKNSEKPKETATRYYISSIKNKASCFQSAIRSHWAVENKLHWTLDVTFSEDTSRKRAGNAAQNYSILLKIALNLLKNESSKKLSMKSKKT